MIGKWAGLMAVLALVVLAGCGSGGAGGAAKKDDGKLKVVCSVGMIGDLAKRIGGEHVNVETLMGAGVDPHLFKALEKHVRQLDAADVVFYNGLHLEGKMVDTFDGLKKENKHVFAVSDGIDKSKLMSQEEGHPDPHVWFDVTLWRDASTIVVKGLSKADPEHAKDFEKNGEALRKELDALHEWCKTELASIPKDRRVMITAHDAFGYFGRAYEVEVHGVQGISTADQAEQQAVPKLVSLIVSKGVKAVFVESSVPRKNIEALIEGCAARSHKLGEGGELFSDAMGEDGTPEGTYPGMIKHNVNTIVKALK